MNHIRPPAVAGSFYPDNVNTLQKMIQELMHQVPQRQNSSTKPKALIVPHAGYIYSGLTAAFGYHQLQQFKQDIKRVILLGPSHRVALYGMAVPSVDYFQTPLGDIQLDTSEINKLVQQGLVDFSDQAHQQEHSLEVQLPFLQQVLDDFTLLPIVVGQSPYQVTSQLLESYINNSEDLIVISTDLSHFLTYQQAQERDQRTANLIENLSLEQLTGHDACGVMPLTGMLQTCKAHDFNITQLDLRNSGDTAGDKQRVVGYGSWAVY